MQLYKKENKRYKDGSTRNIYQFEHLNNCEELKKFIFSLQKKFGNIYNIIVKKYCIKEWIYYHFDNYNDFVKNYNCEDIEEFNIYEFLSDGMHYKIDTVANLIYIYKLNSINQQDSDNYEYYKFNSNLIVRYNNDNANCYYLDNNNEWVYKGSLISLIEDPAYKYEIISDPLSEKKNKR